MNTPLQGASPVPGPSGRRVPGRSDELRGTESTADPPRALEAGARRAPTRPRAAWSEQAQRAGRPEGAAPQARKRQPTEGRGRWKPGWGETEGLDAKHDSALPERETPQQLSCAAFNIEGDRWRESIR